MKKNSLLLLLLLLQVFAYGRKDSSPALQGQPLSFLENKGQIRDQKGNPRTDIDFILQAPGMTLYIGKGQLHYQFIKEQPRDTTTYTQANPPKHYQVGGGVTVSRLDVSLEGANKDAIASKEDPRKSKYHYYTGANPDGVTGVHTYGMVVYKNIYPSIDWVLYTNGKSLKYDFIVHPGGKVSDIQLKYEGAQSMQLQKDGSLKVSGPIGSITEEAPYIYEQESKRAVSGKFMLDKNTLSYQTDPYKGTLVVDPGVEWATYFGGEDGEDLEGMAIDQSGNIYVTGKTYSTSNLATTGAYQTTLSTGTNDAYLAKFDSLGQLQWATYYGGSGSTFILAGAEWSTNVACDGLGNVFIAGSTLSENGIATSGGFQDTLSTGSFLPFNGFVARFNSDGIRQWGTYYGAPATNTKFWAVAADGHGNVYVGGDTDTNSMSGNVVTTGAFQTTYGGGFTDGILVKFDSSGNRQWATYCGTESAEYIEALICDDSNNVFMTGLGFGDYPNLVTPGTHEDVFHPGAGGALVKFNSDGVRQWGTYLHFEGHALALDQFNHLYVGGHTQISLNDTFIVSPGCHQLNTISSSYNAALMQFDPATGTRYWGTYYGSDNTTFAYGVACDPSGNVYLAGTTNAYGLTTWSIATPGTHQDTLNAPPLLSPPNDDGFIVQFDSTGKRKWATYYGGAEREDAKAVACDANGAVYLAGFTESASAIATAGSHQSVMDGTSDAFLVRFLPVDIALQAVVNPDRDTVCAGDVSFSVWVKNQGRMDKEDSLKITYNFNGPSTGSLDTFFAGGLVSGAEDTFGLGSLDLAFPGDYDVTVYLHYTRDDNERDNDTIHLMLTATNAGPVADIEVSQVGTVFHFSNANAQPSDQYHWDFGDGETSTDANPTHEYEVTDSYSVTLVVTGFCGSDTATVMVAGIGDPEGISDPALAGKLSIFPNPAKQALYIKAEQGIKPESYEVINALGQQVLHGSLQQQSSVNLSSLASGTYFIRIKTDKGAMSKQFQVLGK